MRSITVSMPEEMYNKIRILAKQRNVSMAHIVRECLEQKVKEWSKTDLEYGICKRYVEDSVSENKVLEILGTPRKEFHALLEKYHFPIVHTE